MDEVTTEGILEKLGLKSARTLRRWIELGLIPAPSVKPHPGGRGRIATWPATVLDRCLQIREKLREGKKLEEVGELLSRRKYRFADDWAARERQLQLLRVRESATKSLRKFARNSLELLDHQVLTADQLRNAVELVNEGLNPMLIVDESGTTVVPASQVSDRLASQPDSTVLAVVALTNLLMQPHADTSLDVNLP